MGMKQEIDPKVAAIIIGVVVVVVAALIWFFVFRTPGTSGGTGGEGEKKLPSAAGTMVPGR